MWKLYKKELNYYLNNPIGYIIIVLFSVFANFIFIKDAFVIGSASMKPFFGVIPWLLLVFVPALAMRIFAEEKRSNTVEVLLTLPLSEAEIVVAKFLTLLTIMVFGFALTLSLPVSLFFLSKVYLPEILVGYLGIIMMAGFLISLSLFFSNQTKNQIVAFLVSVIIIFLLLVLSTDFLSSVMPKPIQDFLNPLSPVYHLENFAKGIIDIRSVWYFLGLTAVFLFFTVIDLEKRD